MKSLPQFEIFLFPTKNVCVLWFFLFRLVLRLPLKIHLKWQFSAMGSSSLKRIISSVKNVWQNMADNTNLMVGDTDSQNEC